MKPHIKKRLKAGGYLAGRNKAGKQVQLTHSKKGGIAVGAKHGAEGGIKGTVGTEKKPIEFEGEEIVITAPAVKDNSRREFEGQMLTNREILSRINESGGGVSFAKGGKVPGKIRYGKDKTFKVGGKVMSAQEAVEYCGCGCAHSKLEKGGIPSLSDKIKQFLIDRNELFQLLHKNHDETWGLSFAFHAKDKNDANYLISEYAKYVGHKSADFKAEKTTQYKINKEGVVVVDQWMFEAGRKNKFEKGGAIKDFAAIGKQVKKIVRSNKAFEILDADKKLEGSTWTTGGCYPLALALQKVYGGKLKLIVDKDNIPQHVMVAVGDGYLDGDGFSPIEQKFKYARAESVKGPKLADFSEKNLGDVGVGSKETVEKITKLIAAGDISTYEKGGPVSHNEALELVKKINNPGNYVLQTHKNDPEALLAFIQEQATGLLADRKKVIYPSAYQSIVDMVGSKETVLACVAALPADAKEMIRKAWKGKLVDKELRAAVKGKTLAAGGSVSKNPLEMPKADATKYISTVSRQELIDLLSKNDPNGIYSDKDSMQEFGEVASKEDLVESFWRSWDGRDEFENGGAVAVKKLSWDEFNEKYPELYGYKNKGKQEWQLPIDFAGGYKTYYSNGITAHHAGRDIYKQYLADTEIEFEKGGDISAYKPNSIANRAIRQAEAIDNNAIESAHYRMSKQSKKFAAGGAVKNAVDFHTLTPEELLVIWAYKTYKPQYRKENIAGSIAKATEKHTSATKTRVEQLIEQLKSKGFITGQNALSDTGKQIVDQIKKEHGSISYPYFHETYLEKWVPAFAAKQQFHLSDLTKSRSAIMPDKNIEAPLKLSAIPRNESGKIPTEEFTKLVKIIRAFMPPMQLSILADMFRGEERDGAYEIAKRLADTITAMPHTYQTENTDTDDKIVYLHYFYAGSDWYIVEKDKGSPDDENPGEQHQAFGYAILNGDTQNAEWGYISIEEIKSTGKIELDFYFEPIAFGELKKKWEGEKVYKAENIGDAQAQDWIDQQRYDEAEAAPKNKTGSGRIKQPDWLFIGIYPNATVFSDKRKEVNGDYKQIARVLYQPLEVKKMYTGENEEYANVMRMAEDEYYDLLSQHPEWKNTTSSGEKIESGTIASPEKSKIQTAIDTLSGFKPKSIVATLSPFIQKVYKENEQINYHTENIVLLAKKTGNSALINAAALLEYEQEQEGSITPELRELSNRISEIIKIEKAGSGIEQAQSAISNIVEKSGIDKSKVVIAGIAPTKPATAPEQTQQASTTTLGQQTATNIRIRNLVQAKGDDRSKYSAEELALLKLYEGAGSEKKTTDSVRILDQFFTPMNICAKMWGLAFKYGFKWHSSHILEPAVGSGRFLSFIPMDIPAEKKPYVRAYDVDETCATICSLLYPNVDVRQGSFEETFFKGRRHVGLSGVDVFYDLVIGNPPYRDYVSEWAPLGEKAATGATTFEMYFIGRGVDVLKPGGLLIYIIPNTFLSNDNKYNDFKEKLSKKADLIDAYRLPNGVFGNTAVGTDIIVLRRK